jgi:hypothetical protein
LSRPPVWAQVQARFGVAHPSPAPWAVYDAGWQEPGDAEWLWWWTILHVPSQHRAWVLTAREAFSERSLGRIVAALVDRHREGLHCAAWLFD